MNTQINDCISNYVVHKLHLGKFLLRKPCFVISTSWQFLLVKLYRLFYNTTFPSYIHCSPQDTPSILDWPLPQPTYDEVSVEYEDQSEDQEVRSINRGLTEDALVPQGPSMPSRSESQSADLFQELQREVEEALSVSPSL